MKTLIHSIGYADALGGDEQTRWLDEKGGRGERAAGRNEYVLLRTAQCAHCRDSMICIARDLQLIRPSKVVENTVNNRWNNVPKIGPKFTMRIGDEVDELITSCS